jgi:hypothetical protein
MQQTDKHKNNPKEYQEGRCHGTVAVVEDGQIGESLTSHGLYQPKSLSGALQAEIEGINE